MDQLTVRADLLDLNYKAFYEPDLNGLRTAIAFEPADCLVGKKLFGKIKLLS